MITNPYRRALDGWDEQHWIKGSLRAEGGKRCLVGRLTQVGEHEHRLLAVTIEEQYPGRRVTTFGVDGLFSLGAPDPLAIVLDFNDHNDTEFPDVVAVLEKAAVRWDEQQ